MAQPEKKRFPGLLDAFAYKYAKQWLVIFIAAVLMIAAYFYSGHSATQPDGGTGNTAAAAGAKLDSLTVPDKFASGPAKKLWVCPMHPQIIQDQPGVCPICGMDLVEMDQPDAHQHGQSILIDTATQQRLGVRLAEAKLQTLSQDIHTYGNVTVDESLVFNLSAKVEGVIRKLHVNSVGQQVAAGQVLYEIYSPELLKSQFEYIELLKEKDRLSKYMMSDDAHISGKGMSEYDMMELKENSTKRILYIEKFLYADAGKELIEELNRTYRPREVVEVRAPQSGVVTKIEIHEGSSVKPMDSLLSFAGLSQVWVDVPLYPDQVAWVKEGDQVTIRMFQSNMREIKARLKFIAPTVDSTTRTVQARVSINNAKSLLPIGSLLDVIIHAKPHKTLVVPRSAVMRTGKGDMVILSEGNGHFSPVKVETGIETSDAIEITSGLHAGDQVAVNGQFLLDAAASMSDATQRMHGNHDANQP
ncbi:MAG: efflux RND transporter periplasmic adaptor subunit [Gallionella sp.]